MNAIRAFLEPYLIQIKPYLWVIKWVLRALVVAAVFIGGCQYGKSGIEKKQAKAEVAEAKETVRIVYRQGAVTEKVVTKYVDRVRTIRIKGDEIIKEVPVYVTPENDAACTVNAGFVRLWNDANQGEVSDAASGADAAPAEVSLSDIGRQKAAEAKLHRETEAQLEALQEWVREQAEVK